MAHIIQIIGHGIGSVEAVGYDTGMAFVRIRKIEIHKGDVISPSHLFQILIRDIAHYHICIDLAFLKKPGHLKILLHIRGQDLKHCKASHHRRDLVHILIHLPVKAGESRHISVTCYNPDVTAGMARRICMWLIPKLLGNLLYLLKLLPAHSALSGKSLGYRYYRYPCFLCNIRKSHLFTHMLYLTRSSQTAISILTVNPLAISVCCMQARQSSGKKCMHRDDLLMHAL